MSAQTTKEHQKLPADAGKWTSDRSPLPGSASSRRGRLPGHLPRRGKNEGRPQPTGGNPDEQADVRDRRRQPGWRQGLPRSFGTGASTVAWCSSAPSLSGPYERPPLSKDYLRGESERAKAYVHEEGFYEQQDIELITSRSVTGIDPQGGRVTLDDGHEIGYEKAAAHDRIRAPASVSPGWRAGGDPLPADLRRLRRSEAEAGRWRPRGRGGGGMDRERGRGLGSAAGAGRDARRFRCPSPNMRIFGPEVGSFYRDVHAEHDVALALGEGVESFEGEGAVTGVRTASGRKIECGLRRRGRRHLTPRGAGGRGGAGRSTTGSWSTRALRSSAPNVFAAGGRGQYLASVLQGADPRGALGQRTQSGSGSGSVDAR